MTKNLGTIIDAAIAEGLLQTPNETEKSNRPWPVIVFTGLISWLIALPLLTLIALIFELKPGGVTVLGLTLLCMSLVTLRVRTIPLFFEQLATAGLLAGSVGLIIGLSSHGAWQPAAATTGLVALLASPVVPQNWLRSLLGAMATILMILSWTSSAYYNQTRTISPWLSWLIVSLTYLLGKAVISSLEKDPEAIRGVIALEAMITGVGVITLCGLTYDSSPVFVDGDWNMLSWLRSAYLAPPYGSRGISALLAATAAGWLAYHWPALRKRWLIPVALVSVSLAWFIPFMGIILLMLVACLTSGQRKMALLAFVGVFWMIGRFYYYLDLPLTHKSLLLFGCAVTLAVVVRFGFIEEDSIHPVPIPEPKRVPLRTRWLVTGAAILALTTANAAIWQKEKLIKEGTIVFAELAPVDPRSIMQGDYMRLSFRMPEDLSYASRPRTLAVAHRSTNGVIALLRAHDGSKLAPGEMLIELVRKDNWYVIASDAWFFPEGTGERFSRAKYGEFRVTADGHALLVGLRGPGLEKL